MPMYSYICQSCGSEIRKFFGISHVPNTLKCDKCPNTVITRTFDHVGGLGIKMGAKLSKKPQLIDQYGNICESHLTKDIMTHKEEREKQKRNIKQREALKERGHLGDANPNKSKPSFAGDINNPL